MRITRIKTFVVGMTGHNVILVKVETDEGLFGIGEASLAGRDQGYTALRIVPTLFDADPWDSRRSVRATVRTVERLRKVVGEDIDLLVDVHHRYSPMENVHFGRAVEPYDPFFIEDPLPPDNLQSYALLRSKINVPLATGEAMVTKWSFKYLIENELLDYLRIDPIHVGGITETKKIAIMGEVHDIDLALHNPTSPVCAAVCVHLDAQFRDPGGDLSTRLDAGDLPDSAGGGAR